MSRSKEGATGRTKAMLKKSLVKKFLKDRNRRISDEAMELLEYKLERLLDRMSKDNGKFKTIKASMVALYEWRLGS